MASRKVLVVFGATGIQGGSVAETVLSDPGLSQQYRVRGVTRDPSSAAAQALAAKGAEVVAGDLNDGASIKAALQGAHAVFATTVSMYEPGGMARELAQGKAIADEAVAAGAKQIIWSTQRSPARITGGKLPVPSFDVKAEVEEYIRTLPISGVFFAPGSFMENLNTFSAPKPVGDGTYAIFNTQSPDRPLPWIYAGESGKYVGAMLADPAAFDGKFVAASTALYTPAEVARQVGQAAGKTVNHVQIPEEKYRSFLPPGIAADSFVNMLKWFDTVGYYGESTQADVEWAAKSARGKLTTLEKFLSKNAPKLE